MVDNQNFSQGVDLDLLKIFKEYYSNSRIYIKNITQREFGVSFDISKKIERRHMSFSSEAELREFLVEKTPFYISYSAAHYKNPSAPMEKKGLIGADLVFDLDANDLNLKCAEEHGRENICENCFGAIKDETNKLVDFLINDFGLQKDEIYINFSGNRGFHVHVESDKVMKLNASARREICDYLSGTGVEFESLFYEEFDSSNKRIKILHGPKTSDSGWGGKIANALLSSLDDINKLVSLGIPRAEAKKLIEKKEVIKLGLTTGNWDMIYIKNKKKFWKDFVDKQKIQIRDVIDTNVTIDIARLIRLPDSIHGGSGLIAKMIGKANVDDFSLKDAAIPSKEEVKIKVKAPYDFNLFGYNLRKGKIEELQVPLGEAVYFKTKNWLV